MIIPRLYSQACVQLHPVGGRFHHPHDSVLPRSNRLFIPAYLRTPTSMNSSPPPLQSATPRLILASGSDARAGLLRAAHLVFEIQPRDVDEPAIKRQSVADGLSPARTAVRLAEHKAAAVSDPDALVIGADQILTCDGHWFDKPADLASAQSTLRMLRGRFHTLHTAVVCRQHGQVVWRHVAEPRLRMRPVSDAFLNRYLTLEGDRLLSCVGAYRLEATGVHLFESAEGEHAAILGLPMLPLLAFLRRHDVLLS